ncbi:hypothetical protein [Rhodoferax aquaticus]|uniref:Uncharacterized protein n=1 Tax=Rhodoferax aquaticus TaxID=2527691 RepID=A0A515EMG5_9BURK|nr:hypothetical protein [Rhodoferax aquaticus]QDL53857.1 hypothetical protein EXZ61_06550 [Rhodoferax aquaticus]
MTSFPWTLIGLLLCNCAAAQTVSLVSGDDYAPYADSKLPHGGPPLTLTPLYLLASVCGSNTLRR